MADPTTPEQQAQAPAQQAEDYKPRFDGAVRKIEELTLANRQLTADLATKASETEQLRAQLGIKDVEKAAAISERDTQLQSTIQAKTGLETELNELRALKLKIEVIREVGDASLLKIADRIPNLTDKEALKTVMTDFSQFAKDAALEREKQLLAGGSPLSSGTNTQKSVAQPTSTEGWQQLVNSLPLGSAERQKAQDDWWDWAIKQK